MAQNGRKWRPLFRGGKDTKKETAVVAEEGKSSHITALTTPIQQSYSFLHSYTYAVGKQKLHS